MDSTKIKAGYVVTDARTILLQIPSTTNNFGFYLADDDQTWDGGVGAANAWELLPDDDPRITPEARDRLQWILDDLG